MPLPSSIRSDVSSVPELDYRFNPPKLRDSAEEQFGDLSYSAFRFDENGDQIGEGGNAVVYRVTASSSDTPIALKRPFPNKTIERKTVNRIVDEAKTWATVDDHPYIASVLGWDNKPVPWVAIEYVDGGPLDNFIGDFSFPQRLWTAYAIVDAVAYANAQKGVLHHDLNPQNILLQSTPDGVWEVPKVADWGLSRELIQHTGSVSQATYEYAAPEQFDSRMCLAPHRELFS